MANDPVSSSKPSVRFSRVLGVPWLVALGASVTVGLGVYTLLTISVQNLGSGQVIGPYVLLGVVAIPIVLTLAERAAVVPGSGGLYRLARNSGTLWVGYFGGWLMLGGYAVLAALLSWGMALGVDLLLIAYFDLDVNVLWIASAILGLVAIVGLQGMRSAWRTRAAFVYASLAFLAMFSVRNLVAVSLSQAITEAVPRTFELFTVTAFMASALWGLDYVLSVRDQVRRPTKTLLPALGLTVLVGVAFGVAAALALGPSLATPSLTPLIDLAADSRLLPEAIARTLYSVFAISITLIALNRALLNARNLLYAMSRDGFMPERIRSSSTMSGLQTWTSLVFPASSVVLVLFVPVEALVGLAAMTFMWAVAIVHLPDLFRSRPNLPMTTLPFHPIFPGLTAATTVLLPLALGLLTVFAGAAWLALGGLFYLLYGRKRGLEVRRKQIVIGEVSAESAAKPGYRVMADMSHAGHAQALIETGAALARKRGGDLLIISTLQLDDQIPPYLKQQRARQEWDQLDSQLGEVAIGEITARPLVRLAPNHAEGILEAVREEGVDLLLMEWRGSEDPDQIEELDRILRSAPAEVAIVHGEVPNAPSSVVVPTAGGPHAPVALRLAQELTAQSDGGIRIINVLTGELTPEARSEAEAKIQATREAVSDLGEVEVNVVPAESVQDGILAELDDVEVLLIGTTREGILERSRFGGIPTQIARATSIPTIITRARESQSTLRNQRIWGAISDPLPKLSARQHAAVAQSMREAAVPTIDFYVLITLAASIATLGLLQNSGAVIIGAMLVAPLMAPILAMGMSMVQAETRVFVLGVEATIKGIALAILVGLVIVIISPITDPTAEILARTQPNILDLMVALASGAAAGYAISRSEVAAAMPGVAISAALVPPLCVVGYGLGVSDLSISAGALLLFTTNLIAIVLAAGITFLALGFQPERGEKGELARGLRLAAVSLAAVFVILAIVTIRTVEQQDREDAVVELFEQQVVAQVGRVEDLVIERKGNGFILTATIISYRGNQLSAEDLGKLEDDITEAVGGPVTLDATFLDAERVQTALGGLQPLRSLEQIFAEAAVSADWEVIDVQASKGVNGFLVEATVIVTNVRPLSEQDLTEIQDQLMVAVDDSVELHVLSLSGNRIELSGGE